MIDMQNYAVNYREIFDAINDAIFIHDKETGAMLDVNKRVYAMFACTREEALNLNVGNLSLGAPPYDDKHAAHWIQKAVTEGPQTFEWRAKRRTGELFWAEVNLQCVRLDGHQRVLAIIRNISDLWASTQC